MMIPKVAAANTYVFTSVQTVSPAQATSVDQEGGDLDFHNWVQRGKTIRGGDSVSSCLANLTAALELVGSLNAAEYNGAAGALSILPTAGALLGAPTREMWIVYKLVPIAGVLSMLLSLGGSLTPSNVGHYNPDESFSYGGFMPTNLVTVPQRQESRPSSHVDDQHQRPKLESLHGEPKPQNQKQKPDISLNDMQSFAQEVRIRAEEPSGGSIFLGIWFAMALQVGLIVALLIPMYFAQQGAVITWWCRAWGWMWFWYFLVTAVAIFDNLVAAPFMKSWTIRVSKAQTGLMLGIDAPKIWNATDYPNAFEFIKSGPGLNRKIRVSPDQGLTYPRTCFYVVISVNRISSMHAAAQVIAKCSNVAVFAFGTALFASATLLSISSALMVLCLILPAGVAGRVIATWIVSAMSRQNKPILHKTVRSENDAAEYFEELSKLPNIQMEIDGHVIVNGTVVTSRHKLFTPATYIGLLAKPFDVLALNDEIIQRPVNSNIYMAGMYLSRPALPSLPREYSYVHRAPSSSPWRSQPSPFMHGQNFDERIDHTCSWNNGSGANNTVYAAGNDGFDSGNDPDRG
ncbi:hypothetical protein PFICI_04346 [Pestalotiopsis fici W106-1]|uniref:Uncharacterized protein n=1 Tax=Pestalotiopsis fici (strain W106-1 / CGMCC3.15140) TaxID=1229662 RepID=W3X8V2_PESFW|nr:uncharacterized protein PFICI_04346 [Pestalotiopsis fici W106-1]ETS82470.1 hypothetical protein PFICI_04346 [Pestalotiopsis fici W106-1]